MTARSAASRHADEVLGNTPPGSFDSIQAGLVRLRRVYDADDETQQSRGFNANQPDRARVWLIDSLIDWIRPAVEAEKARWDAEDASLQAIKDARALDDALANRPPE